MLRLPPFQYHRPRSITEAVRLIGAEPDAMFVAGGTDLYPNMKRRHQEPRTVISLGGIPELHGVRGSATAGLRLGAMTTLSELVRSEALRASYPEVAATAALISTPLLRNMGTIGGNILLDTRCNYYNQTYEWRRSINFCMKKDGEICWVAPSSPRCWAVQSSDQAPLLCAMGAEVQLVSHEGGERTVPVASLYRDDGIDYLAKRRDELLTEVVLPARNGWRATYYKVRRRGSFDFPVLGVAAAAWFDGEICRDARIVLGGVGSHPIEVPAAREALVGEPLSEEPIRAAALAAAHPPRPLDNTDYHMSWRKKVIRAYCERALRNLASATPAGSSDQLDGTAFAGRSLPVLPAGS